MAQLPMENNFVIPRSSMYVLEENLEFFQKDKLVTKKYKYKII